MAQNGIEDKQSGTEEILLKKNNFNIIFKFKLIIIKYF